MGSFLQINPVWLFGPYHPWDATTNAQPDWYMGWLEGAVRLMPAWDIQVGGFLLPAIFWPAVVLPGLVFTPLFVWPWLDALATRDNGFHNVLTLPGERPGRMALGAGLRHVPHGAARGRRERRVRGAVRPFAARPVARAPGPGRRAAAGGGRC